MRFLSIKRRLFVITMKKPFLSTTRLISTFRPKERKSFFCYNSLNVKISTKWSIFCDHFNKKLFFGHNWLNINISKKSTKCWEYFEKKLFYWPKSTFFDITIKKSCFANSFKINISPKNNVFFWSLEKNHFWL